MLSGILVGTSYIPFPPWAILFCYIPLWLACQELQNQSRPFFKIFLAGWFTQFILTLIGFNWIAYTSHEFGGFNWPLSILGLLVFAIAVHIYVPLSLVLAFFLIRRRKILNPLSQFLIMAITMALVERAWPSIFEWNLGYTLLWANIPLFHWADMVGFWGLSTWLLVSQATLAWAWTLRASERKNAKLIVGGVVGTLITLSAVGLAKKANWSKSDDVVKFAVTQGNIGNAEKIQSEKKDKFQSYILEIFSNLTDEHLKKSPDVDVMLWPETAMPFALDQSFHTRFLQQILLQKVQHWNFVLATGGYSQDLTKKDLLGYYLTRNSVFFLSPLKILAAPTYHKTALLAFGEYLPFGETFPWLYTLFPFVGMYERGPGPSPQKVEIKNQRSIVLGPQICYESLDPSFSRGLAMKGSQIIFNVTNDSWFGWWAEPFQHNIMTLARAVEVRRPLVRATNTGVSSAILANGERLESSEMDKSWTHTFNIPYQKNPRQSFYTKFGYLDWVVWSFILVGLLFKEKYVRD